MKPGSDRADLLKNIVIAVALAALFLILKNAKCQLLQ